MLYHTQAAVAAKLFIFNAVRTKIAAQSFAACVIVKCILLQGWCRRGVTRGLGVLFYRKYVEQKGAARAGGGISPEGHPHFIPTPHSFVSGKRPSRMSGAIGFYTALQTAYICPARLLTAPPWNGHNHTQCQAAASRHGVLPMAVPAALGGSQQTCGARRQRPAGG